MHTDTMSTHTQSVHSSHLTKTIQTDFPSTQNKYADKYAEREEEK